MTATDPKNALMLPCGRRKVSTTGASDRARLNALNAWLRGLPSLEFTSKGRANICARFKVDDAELTAAVAALQSPRPNQPTPELLDTISRAVSRANATGGASKW